MEVLQHEPGILTGGEGNWVFAIDLSEAKKYYPIFNYVGHNA